MNEKSALWSYLNLSILILGIVFLGYFFFRFIRSRKKALEKKKTQGTELVGLKNELKHWQSLPALFKRVAYLGDLEQSLDNVSLTLLSLLDASSVSYLLKTPKGFTFRARVTGDVTKSYLSKSKETVSRRFSEFSNFSGEILADEHVNGGQVTLAIEGDKAGGVSDFLNSAVVVIRVEDKILGAFGVFGSNNSLDSAETKLFISKTVDLAVSLLDDYKKALTRERGRLESVLQSMEEGVMLVDSDYKISVINSTACAFLSVSDVRPQNISDAATLFKGALPLQETVSTVMDSGESKTLKRIFVNNKYLGLTFIPVSFGKEVIGVGVIMHNDSEEENLKNLREDFTAMVVHELRAPLTVIRGSADMVLTNRDKFTQKDIDLFLNQIKTSAWELLKLVSDLLDSAKIESGKFTVNKAACALNEVLKQEVSSYKVFTDSKNIDLVLDLDNNVPTVQADKEKIIQVLNNLMSNAVKFTYKGDITHMGERGFVKVGSRMQGGSVQIFVADNGKGISAEVKKQLFNKFVQARESNISNESGTGLGLVIAKGIVEAHGGKIWVEDNVPKGSVFIFTIPV